MPKKVKPPQAPEPPTWHPCAICTARATSRDEGDGKYYCDACFEEWEANTKLGQQASAKPVKPKKKPAAAKAPHPCHQCNADAFVEDSADGEYYCDACFAAWEAQTAPPPAVAPATAPPTPAARKDTPTAGKSKNAERPCNAEEQTRMSTVPASVAVAASIPPQDPVVAVARVPRKHVTLLVEMAGAAVVKELVRTHGVGISITGSRDDWPSPVAVNGAEDSVNAAVEAIATLSSPVLPFPGTVEDVEAATVYACHALKQWRPAPHAIGNQVAAGRGKFAGKWFLVLRGPQQIKQRESLATALLAMQHHAVKDVKVPQPTAMDESRMTRLLLLGATPPAQRDVYTLRGVAVSFDEAPRELLEAAADPAIAAALDQEDLPPCTPTPATTKAAKKAMRAVMKEQHKTQHLARKRSSLNVERLVKYDETTLAPVTSIPADCGIVVDIEDLRDVALNHATDCIADRVWDAFGRWFETDTIRVPSVVSIMSGIAEQIVAARRDCKRPEVVFFWPSQSRVKATAAPTADTEDLADFCKLPIVAERLATTSTPQQWLRGNAPSMVYLGLAELSNSAMVNAATHGMTIFDLSRVEFVGHLRAPYAQFPDCATDLNYAKVNLVDPALAQQASDEP